MIVNRNSPGEDQCLGRFLAIISQDPSVSKSNQLHVVIAQFSFTTLYRFPCNEWKFSRVLEVQPIVLKLKTVHL